MAHSSGKFNWDDLKYLVAVARHGSTLAAGRALAVDQSTVQRRLLELERRVGQALVQRHATGYRLTAFGEQLLPMAQGVAQAVQVFEDQLTALKADFSGVIRTPGKVLVGRNGRAECTMHAGTVVVGGVVKGEITSTEKVIVLSTGLVIGNITTPRLIVEEGVILDGACRVTAPERPTGDAGKAGAAGREPAPAAAARR